MSGRNQHHIPQFFQRAFGVKAKSKPKEIWVYRANEAAELGQISKIAADWDFYSSPSTDGSATLDDKITKAENPLSNTVRAIRDQASGTIVDAAVAAEVVMQLAPRSSHIRTSFAAGLKRLAASASEIFTDPEQIERLLGLDEDQPTEVFRDHLRGILKDHPAFEMVGLPTPVLERAAFYVARETFDATLEDSLPTFGMLFDQWESGTAPLAREGHNRALESWDERPNRRREHLEMLAWTVEAAPPEGAILPDCIALAFQTDTPPLPLMFVGTESDHVVMPLSTRKLLVGRRKNADPWDVSTFNREAAACSHEFFLAAIQSDEFEALATETGLRTAQYFDNATEEAIGGFLSPQSEPTNAPAVEGDSAIASNPTQNSFSYQVSCLQCGEDDVAHEIAAVVKDIVNVVAQSVPMARLDGITFAADYPTALREVDRGHPDWPPMETVSADAGIGIARMVMVLRDEQVKGRIVINGFVAHCLIGTDQKDAHWALHVLAQQLMLVGMLDWIEQALPGTLRKTITNDFDAMLYREVDAALHGFVAARFSGHFGDHKEMSNGYCDLLVQSLDAMKNQIEVKRLAYRYDGNLDDLLGLAMPMVGRVLHFAAQYLGHCEATERPVLDNDLTAALQRTGLVHWLPDFGRDLNRFSQRLGKWESFDEFLAFNRHVERLLWSVGMFPWESPTGNRVEVPLFSDALALMAAEGHSEN